MRSVPSDGRHAEGCGHAPVIGTSVLLGEARLIVDLDHVLCLEGVGVLATHPDDLRAPRHVHPADDPPVPQGDRDRIHAHAGLGEVGHAVTDRTWQFVGHP